jgi:multidrug efflux pump subunit AcrA (membrane-fusion protein)
MGSADANPPGPPRTPEVRDERPAHPSHRTLWITATIAFVVLVIALAAGYLPRHRRVAAAEEAAQRERESLPVVNVVEVKRSDPVAQLLLPGNITPLTEASIYARATGYLTRRLVDIGDRVQHNQLMAVIEAPDLDQQVAQARAGVSQAEQQLAQAQSTLEQAHANLELARVTWDRYKILVERGAIARQDADTQYATYKTSQATVSADEANVRAAAENVRASGANLERVMALQSFEQVRAPFDGIVTARNVDVGAFISSQGGSTGGGLGTSAAGVSSGNAGELFRVAQIDRLRILIDLPQTETPDVQVGQSAGVLVQQYPNRQFPGTLTRTALALDPASRTMTTEIQLPNPARLLLPGMYAQVQLISRRTNPPLLVPGDSIVSEADGLRVATVQGPPPVKQGQVKNAGDSRWRVHFQTVQVGRDYGPQTEITSGLEGGEFVVVNPSDVVHEGAEVAAQLAPAGAGSGHPGGAQDRRPGGISTPNQRAGEKGK